MVRTWCSFPCIQRRGSLLFDSETVAHPNKGTGTVAERSCIARRGDRSWGQWEWHRDQLWSPLPSGERNQGFPQALSKYSSWHGCSVPLSWGAFTPRPRAMVPEGSEDRVPVCSVSLCLTLGCLCRTQTALKAKGYLIYSPWIYGRHISRESVIAFMWPISRGRTILKSLGAGTAAGSFTSVSLTMSLQEQGRDNSATASHWYCSLLHTLLASRC